MNRLSMMSVIGKSVVVGFWGILILATPASAQTGAVTEATAPAAASPVDTKAADVTVAPSAAADTNAVTQPPPAAAAQEQPETVPELTKPRHGFLSDHLEIGLGYASFSLTDNKGNGRFLGSIDELAAENDSFVFPVVGVYLNRYVGLECRYEQYEARTYTDTANNHSDGVVKISGPVFSVIGRLPLDTVAGLFDASETTKHRAAHVVPFAGIGQTFFDETLAADAWWAKGYDSPESYDSLGRPDANRNGKSRSFALDKAQATTFILGAAILIGDSLSLNAAWTSAKLDLDSRFYVNNDLTGNGAIPFHYSTTSLDLRYRF